MAVIPNRGAMVQPINWSGSTDKTTMKVAGYELSGTIGWRPYTETATFTWILTRAQANTMLEEFAGSNFNAVYNYPCLVRGDIRVRLSGDYSLEETNEFEKVRVTAGVRRV